MKPKTAIVDIYLFEVIERITRFYTHLEKIREQFYANNRSSDKLTFIEEHISCLIKQLEIIVTLIKISDSSLGVKSFFSCKSEKAWYQALATSLA